MIGAFAMLLYVPLLPIARCRVGNLKERHRDNHLFAIRRRLAFAARANTSGESGPQQGDSPAATGMYAAGSDCIELHADAAPAESRQPQAGRAEKLIRHLPPCSKKRPQFRLLSITLERLGWIQTLERDCDDGTGDGSAADRVGRRSVSR